MAAANSAEVASFFSFREREMPRNRRLVMTPELPLAPRSMAEAVFSAASPRVLGALPASSRAAADASGMGGSIGDDIPAENLYKIIKSYGQRTALYRRLGFDAVTVHMSYRAQVPGQLLSPLTNFRTDEFGGSFENRCRFALLMLREIRRVAGKDMLVEIQFSAEEPEGGYSFEEGLEFLRTRSF